MNPFETIPYVKFCEEKNTVFYDGEKRAVSADDWKLLSKCLTRIRVREVAQRLCGKEEQFCPYCGSTQIDAEYVDIGVGHQRVTPFYCYACAAEEMTTYYDDISLVELILGWYKPYPGKYGDLYD